MREILTTAALLYFFGFGLASLRIKEGNYPPPDTKLRKGFFAALQEFGRQSFTVRIYWYYYLVSATAGFAGACSFANVFFQTDAMGLTREEWGQLAGIVGAADLVAVYFASIYMDRWHPFRVCAYTSIFGSVAGIGGWIWVMVTLPPKLYFWLTLAGLLVKAFTDMLQNACFGPLGMRIKPKSLYGQFSAANQVVKSVAVIIAGLVAGLFLDFMKWTCSSYGKDFGYRWIFIWSWAFGCLVTLFLYLGYREWRRLGGDNHYRPPAPWMAGGFDTLVDTTKSVLTRLRPLRLSMVLNVACAAINVVLVPALMYYMWHKGITRGCYNFAIAVLPASVILAVLAYWQMMRVQRDVRERVQGRTTKLGVPHHGVLLAIAIQNLCLCPVWVWQVVASVNLGMVREAVLFGVANVIMTAAGLLGIHLIRWMERDVPGSLFPEPPLQGEALPAEAS